MKRNIFRNSGLILFSMLLVTGLCAQTVKLVTAGAGQWVVTGNTHTVLTNGEIINNGTIVPASGQFIFRGSASSSNTRIAGSAPADFYDLIMDKTSNGIQLNNNIRVSHLLQLQSGDSLLLNNYVIDLLSSGSLSGETETRRISGIPGGYIQITQTLNAPVAVNPGNLGVEITSAANLGSTIIRRGHKQQANASVFRYFDITPSNNTALNASLRIHYFDAELASVGEGNLGLFISKDEGSHWRSLGEDELDQSGNSILKNNLDTLARFTMANFSEPLAFSLLYFQGQALNHQSLLKWATVSETENESFLLERSGDGRIFYALATVKGAGNSSIRRDYSYTDIQPLAAMNYYRLRQVSTSGRIKYSPVVAVNFSENNTALVSAFPNPAREMVYLKFNALTEGEFPLQVFDASGKLVLSRTVHVIRGVNQFNLDLQAVPAGMYQCKLAGTEGPALRFIHL